MDAALVGCQVVRTKEGASQKQLLSVLHGRDGLFLFGRWALRFMLLDDASHVLEKSTIHFHVCRCRSSDVLRGQPDLLKFVDDSPLNEGHGLLCHKVGPGKNVLDGRFLQM